MQRVTCCVCYSVLLTIYENNYDMHTSYIVECVNVIAWIRRATGKILLVYYYTSRKTIRTNTYRTAYILTYINVIPWISIAKRKLLIVYITIHP